MLVDRFGYSEEEAGSYVPIPNTVVAVIGPILGLYLDKVGNRLTMTNFGSILLVITQIIDMLSIDCRKCNHPIIVLIN